MKADICYCINKCMTKVALQNHCMCTLIGLDWLVWSGHIFERNITTLENTPTPLLRSSLSSLPMGIFLRDYSTCVYMHWRNMKPHHTKCGSGKEVQVVIPQPKTARQCNLNSLGVMSIYIYIYICAHAYLLLTAMSVYIYAHIQISAYHAKLQSQTRLQGKSLPNKFRTHLSTYITSWKRQEGAVLMCEWQWILMSGAKSEAFSWTKRANGLHFSLKANNLEISWNYRGCR